MESNEEIAPGDSGSAEIFVQKAARCLAEIQSNVNNVGDVLVFLEVLGYKDVMARHHGFQGLGDLARSVLEYVEFYNEPPKPTSFSLKVPGVARRAAETLALASPWLGAWLMLLVFGVSLWLSNLLPATITTAFMIGVYLAIMISGGQLHGTGRLLSLHKGQTNISEMRRILKRSYTLLFAMLLGTTAMLYSIGIIADIPPFLILVSIISEVTLTLQLSGYVIIYVLKKIPQILASYAVAIVILLLVYFKFYSYFPSWMYGYLTTYLPDVVARYFLGLGAAFAVLSVAGLYYNARIFATNNPDFLVPDEEKQDQEVLERPSFYTPVSLSSRTINSHFGTQLWESLPYYIFGTFFFGLLFGDRVFSWIYNPHNMVGGVTYPLLFNPAYHAGADIALLVLFPAMIIQYVMMAPVYERIHNMSISLKVTDAYLVDSFINKHYEKVFIATIASSTISACFLIYIGPSVVSLLGGSIVSIHILFIAAISNILMSVFGANSLFLVLLNKIRSVALISVVGTIFLALISFVLGPTGFENIVYAYLAMNVLVMTWSLSELRGALLHGGSIHLAKFT